MVAVVLQILGGALLVAAFGVSFGLGGGLAAAGVFLLAAGTLIEVFRSEPEPDEPTEPAEGGD
jgi:hypothetical protein